MTLDELIKLFPYYSIHFTPISGDERWEVHFYKGLWNEGVHIKHRNIFIGNRSKKDSFSTLEEAIDFIVETYSVKESKQETLPMKVTLSKDDLKQALQSYLNAHVVKKPVVVEDVTVLNLSTTSISSLNQSFDLEVELIPEEKAEE